MQHTKNADNTILMLIEDQIVAFHRLAADARSDLVQLETKIGSRGDEGKHCKPVKRNMSFPWEP